MATILSVTLNTTTSGYGQTRKSERSEIVRLLGIIEQHIGSGADNSGTLLDLNGASAGSYTYTPVASS